MPGVSPRCDQPVRRTNQRSSARWWLVVLVAAVPIAFCYLNLVFWFFVHQREFLYTRGGTSGSPKAVGLEGFAGVSISTEDGEHIVAW